MRLGRPISIRIFGDAHLEREHPGVVQLIELSVRQNDGKIVALVVDPNRFPTIGTGQSAPPPYEFDDWLMVVYQLPRFRIRLALSHFGPTVSQERPSLIQQVS